MRWHFLIDENQNLMQLKSIHIYPLKSARGVVLASAQLTARGLEGDRRWMLIDPQGKFITARQLPQLVLIDAQTTAAGLRLQVAGQTAIQVPTPTRERAKVMVTIWQSPCPARIADAAANDWISRVIGHPARLVYLDDDCLRGVAPAWSEPGDQVSFADGFPLLLIGSASLDELNRRLPQAVTMARFRPNLVVQTALPFIEDSWRQIALGGVRLAVSKPCTRCVLTTVDPESGVKNGNGEPLKTLASFRRTALGICFGQNLIPRSVGRLQIGDRLSVLA